MKTRCGVNPSPIFDERNDAAHLRPRAAMPRGSFPFTHNAGRGVRLCIAPRCRRPLYLYSVSSPALAACTADSTVHTARRSTTTSSRALKGDSNKWPVATESPPSDDSHRAVPRDHLQCKEEEAGGRGPGIMPGGDVSFQRSSRPQGRDNSLPDPDRSPRSIPNHLLLRCGRRGDLSG